MKVLIDNNLSMRVADAIALLVELDGHHVEHIRRKFSSPAISDVEWIGSLAAEGGWSVISADLRITRNPAERDAWRRARLKGFFLEPSWHKLPSRERAAYLLLWWPRIVQQEALIAPGAAFLVPRRPTSKLRQLTI